MMEYKKTRKQEDKTNVFVRGRHCDSCQQN